MNEKKEQNVLNGVIIKIFKPRKGEEAFNTVIEYGFKIQAFKEKKVISCYGKSFELFEGENVKLTGKYVRKPNQPEYFVFDDIKIDLANIKSHDYYIRIFGSYYEKIHDIEKNNKVLIEHLNQDDRKYFCDMLEVAEDSSVVKKFFTKYSKIRNLYDGYEKLSKYGLSLNEIQKMMKEKTVEEVQETIKRNPYRLINEVRFTFNQCDIINAHETGNYLLKGRLTAGVVEALKEDYAQGNTYTFRENIINRAKAILNVEGLYENRIAIPEKTIVSVLNTLIEHKLIINDSERYYLSYVYLMEEYLRGFCKTVLSEGTLNVKEEDIRDYISSYEQQKGFCLGVEQKEAVINSLNHRVSIITGGAGTGKTSSLAVIVKYYLEHGYTEKEIALCAPTGKAGQRMMESINGQLGSDLRASTIHVLLGAKGTSIEEFTYNESHKLDSKIIVVDETSMLDLSVAYALISAIKKDSKIIFLGDIDQLPPVMAGYFLRDLIESKIPCVKLFEIHRQKGDSSIIPLSMAIKQNSLPRDFGKPRSDYCFVPSKGDNNKNIEWLVNTYIRYVDKRINEEMALFPKGTDVSEEKQKEIRERVLDEIMIVTPLRDTKNKEFPTMNGQYISNKIQEKLFKNYTGKQFSKNGYTFKIGSKIIISKNNNEKGLTNGQIGYIRDINLEEKTVVIYSDSKYYDLSDDDLNNLLLAYAITVHKSQGTDWKLVIYCCFKETKMNQRNLVYTAITRAKKSLIVFGDYETFASSPTNYGALKRSRLLND